MAYETIELNLIPSGTVQVIHAAQYDKERPLIFKLMLGDDDFNPSGYDLELQVRKVDNNIVTVSDCTVSGNIVTFLTSEQMTACSGTNLGEIQISKDDMSIATLHFYLVVQRDVLVGGITSQSDIHNLEEQIEELLPSALGNEYYTKTQTDTLLNSKADTSSLAAVATSGNYNDLSNKPTIPAAQVNSDWNAESGVAMILNKPTIPAAQVQSDWDQADNTKVDYIKNKPTIPTIETATIQNVPIATFTDGADNVPVKSLKVDIDANLSGVSSVNVVNISGNVTNLASYIRGIYRGNYGFVDLGSLTWQYDSSVPRFLTDGLQSVIKAGVSGVIPNMLTPIFTATEIGNIYNPNYNMSISVSGGSVISVRDTTYSDATAFKNAMNGVYLIYELATPTTPTITQAQLTAICTSFGVNGTTYPISLGETLTQGGVLDVTTGLLTRTDETTSQLTPTQVKTLLGNNNIFADSGNVNEVVYFKTGCESIARLIESYM